MSNEPKADICLPEFEKALKECADAYDMKVWRYTNGQLPRFARWLLRNPHLAEALARDARSLAEHVQPERKAA